MKRIILVLVMIAAAIPASASSHAREAGKPVDTINEVPRRGRLALFKAQEKKNKGDYEGAAGILGEFIEKNPGDAHFLIYYNYGNALLRLERPEEALGQYQKAVGIEARFWQGWLNLGETAYNLERYQLAAEAIMSGYRQSPEKNPRLLYFAAVAYMMSGKTGEAKRNLEELVFSDQPEPKMDWYRALLMACIDLEDVQAGKRAVDRMLEIFPDSPESWKLAFQFAASNQDYRSAAIAMTVKGYLEPLERNEMMQLGSLYAVIEVPWTASTYYEEAVALEAGPEDFERLASVYMAAHEPQKALETLERALAKQPTAKLWSILGDLYYMEEDYDKSYEAFGNCYEMDSDSGRSLLMMGFCALELGRADSAVSHLKKAAGFPDYTKNANALLKRALQMQGG